MELGTCTSSTADLLSMIADDAQSRRSLELREWQHVVAWAGDNIIDTTEGAATLREGYVDTGVPIAGPGAPLVSEFALMELVAVLGRSPDGGRAYVGRIIECAWRLPELSTQVLEGRVETWRAARVAELTHPLSAEAAGFVDHHLARAVGKVSWAMVERLVREAILRHDLERAELERRRAADRRRVDLGEVDEHGYVTVTGLVDGADARDLDEAIAREAQLLGRLGDDSPLDVRRAKALGALARRDLALDLLVPDPETGEVVDTVPGRRAELTIHITDTTLTGDNPVARWEETRSPVSSEQVREWLQVPGTTITVRPVIDLADSVPVGSYEVPDRLRRQVGLRDQTCRFPHCSRPAEACDLDHVVPWADGGPTSAPNLVPLCRRHHRAKTHSTWHYRVLRPGHYRWTSPHGHQFHVDPAGTRGPGPRRPHRP